MKNKFSGIFNSDYEETLKTFNELIELERHLDSESVWTDKLGRLSGNFEKNWQQLESYKEILENEQKISQMEKVLGKSICTKNSSFFITANNRTFELVKKQQENKEN